ncbi:MAG TPA: MFS transporter, partial [Gaiellaceae bacterium]
TVRVANVAAFFLGAALFSVIIYLPLFAQGVLGDSATRSGVLLIPLNFAWITASALSGRYVTRTGRYRIFPVIGSPLALVGVYLLSRLNTSSGASAIIVASVFLGCGMGLTVQTYVIALQNSVARSDLGVATAANQFFRSIGGALAVAAYGTLLISRLGTELARRSVEGISPQELLRAPGTARHLPPTVVHGVHAALSTALERVFVWTLPLLAAAVAMSLLLRETPLRTSAQPEMPAEVSGTD